MDRVRDAHDEDDDRDETRQDRDREPGEPHDAERQQIGGNSGGQAQENLGAAPEEEEKKPDEQHQSGAEEHSLVGLEQLREPRTNHRNASKGERCVRGVDPGQPLGQRLFDQSALFVTPEILREVSMDPERGLIRVPEIPAVQVVRLMTGQGGCQIRVRKLRFFDERVYLDSEFTLELRRLRNRDASDPVDVLEPHFLEVTRDALQTSIQLLVRIACDSPDEGEPRVFVREGAPILLEVLPNLAGCREELLDGVVDADTRSGSPRESDDCRAG